MAFILAALACMWPMFGAGSPPGVDTPTFLHLAWVTELALKGQLTSPLVDPYWYGGYPYLQSYPPLAYGAIGLVSAATPIPVEIAYRLLLLLAYATLGVSVYALALELGVRRFGATLAGLLVLTSYPALMGLAVYGWFSTLAALPLGILGLTMLEQAIRLDSRGRAVASGLLFACAILAHHMTGFAFAIALAPWLAYRLAAPPSARDVERTQAAQPVGRRRMLELALCASGTAAVLSTVWGIFFLLHVLDVGFQREVPGIWQVSIQTFVARLFDRTLIGVETYPTYLGITQVGLGLAGLFYAIFTRSRTVGLAPALLATLWFAAGQDVNPLIAVYPFSGLDVARFSLFLMPFLAVFAGLLLDAIAARASAAFARPGSSIGSLLPHSRALPAIALGAISLLIMALPSADTAAARPGFSPVAPAPGVQQALEWVRQETPTDTSVLAVGLRHWSGWWIPYHANRAVMDGWSDEGAPNWRPIREVRHMAWQGNADAERLHEVMTEQGAGFLLIAHWFSSEHPGAFEEAIEAAPDLFEQRAEWADVAIYEVVQ